MNNISDFKLASATIKKVCLRRGFKFHDLSLSFEDPQGSFKSGRLNVGNSQSIAQTLFNITSSYIKAGETIYSRPVFDSEAQRNDFLTYCATAFRRLMVSSRFPEAKPDDIFAQRLYQRPLVWSLMKNVVSPIFNAPVRNVQLVCGTSPFVDIAHFYAAGETKGRDGSTEPFIFVNDDVENESVKNAALFIEAIRAHGLSPVEVIKELYDSTLHEKVCGTVKLALVGEAKLDEFVASMFLLLGFDQKKDDTINKASVRPTMRKQAQFWDSHQGMSPMTWWYMGLIEKMLEPARGYDWGVRQSLQGDIEKFWNNVEQLKAKKKQGDGIPFDQLLRLQSGFSVDKKINPKLTYQQLLGEQRIWSL